MCISRWVKHVDRPHSNGAGKRLLKLLAEVFNPLMPAFIIAGIAQGIATLIGQLVPSYADSLALSFTYALMTLVNSAFTPVMSAWIGYLTCDKNGGTPILGGMLGMMTVLSGIDGISSILGMEAVLQSGTGGVIAAFCGAVIIAKVERRLHEVIPKSLDMVLTPMIAMVTVSVVYVLVIMPVAGKISQYLCTLIELLSSRNSLPLRLLAGFFAAAVFLPMNVAGLQHGIIALYPIQLEKYGYITLYPVFAMAGAGQVGAGIAVWLMAKHIENNRLAQVAFSAAIPGALGIGSPLIYGVTLQIPKAFVASCIGAGVGGAFMMCTGVFSTGWGPSGLLAIPMMAAGNMSVLESMGLYVLGLGVSFIAGFFLCLAMVHATDIKTVYCDS